MCAWSLANNLFLLYLHEANGTSRFLAAEELPFERRHLFLEITDIVDLWRISWVTLIPS